MLQPLLDIKIHLILSNPLKNRHGKNGDFIARGEITTNNLMMIP